MDSQAYKFETDGNFSAKKSGNKQMERGKKKTYANAPTQQLGILQKLIIDSP